MKQGLNFYNLVLIGNYTKDTIVSPSGTKIIDGGGVNYGAHVAAKMGLKVAVITQLSKDNFHVVDALRRLGVDVFATETPCSTQLRLEYPTSNMEERIISAKSFAGSFTNDHIRDLQARTFLISTSMRDEVSLEIIKEIKKKGGQVAVDVQGFLRTMRSDGTLIYEKWPEKNQLLSQIDILKADAEEAEMLSGESDIKVAAQKITDQLPMEVVITHRDGLLVFARSQYYDVPFFPKKLVGRSGRGDTCIAAYIAKRLFASVKDATVWAAAVTSLKMEAEGPFRRDVYEVEELIRRKYRSYISDNL